MIRTVRESMIPRALGSLIGLITLVSVALISILVALEHRRLVSSLEDQAAVLGDQLAATLAFPVWNAIFREIDSQLDWVMVDPAVCAVNLDMKDIVPPLRSRSRDMDWRPVAVPGTPRGDFVVERVVAFEGRPIAKLELCFTKRFIEERIAREALLFAAVVLVADSTLALGLILILRVLIFLPLRRIERYAWSVSVGTIVAIPPWEGGRGEIESLHSSIEKMVYLLGERYRALVTKEGEFRSLFERSPVPTVEFDFSAVPAAIRAEGLALPSIRAKLLDVPDAARRLLSKVRAKSANESAVRVFGEDWKTTILEGISAPGGEDALALFIDEISDLANRSRGASGECNLRLRGGEEHIFILDFATLAGHEENWSRVILTMTDITARARAEARLRKALAEKDTLVQELFHRTRNSLQIIGGLITLSESRITDTRSMTELRGLAKRVQALALAQDQLHKLNDLSYVDLGEYLRTMLPTLVGGEASPVRVAIDAGKVTAVIDVAMPLGIALVELVTNAQEHGFPDGRSGTISVTLELADDGCVEISVRDDGIGPPPGFDPRRDASLGLELVFILIEGQLRGRVEFDFSAGFGCRLRFGMECFELRI